MIVVQIFIWVFLLVSENMYKLSFKEQLAHVPHEFINAEILVYIILLINFLHLIAMSFLK